MQLTHEPRHARSGSCRAEGTPISSIPIRMPRSRRARTCSTPMAAPWRRLAENRVAELAQLPVAAGRIFHRARRRRHAARCRPHQAAGLRSLAQISGDRLRLRRARRQEVRDAWQGPDFLWHQLMAQKGFVIFSVDNRGMSGRGHEFRNAASTIISARRNSPISLAGVAWLEPNSPMWIAARIGIWGWSYGGYMTCMAMLRGRRRFQGGICRRAGHRLAPVRHHLHRALHGHAAGKSRQAIATPRR